MANSDLSKEAFVPVPRIPQDVVAYLDLVFPEKCADLGETMDSVFHRSGQRAVVRYLIRLFQDQNDNVLNA